jgi:PKD repeat protein
MKKILFTLLTGLLMSLAALAQNYSVTVYGTVSMVVQNSVIPVANQAVIVTIDSSSTGFTYQNTVFTDESGYYEDVIGSPWLTGYEFVQTRTYDSCLSQYLYNAQQLVPGVTLIPMDFLLCNSISPECQSMFIYYQVDPADPYTYSFMNVSTGNYTEMTWSFGDSTFSNEANPIHTFPAEGSYYVCLTISDGTFCTSTYCEFLYIGNGGGIGCESYFIYNYDFLDPYTLTFEGFMFHDQQAQYYSWDFGDGTTGTGPTVTHTYQPQGMAVYMVGLTTMTLDSLGMDTCVYTTYQEVWIQNQGGCNAYFTYYPDSTNQLTINFMDMSYDANGIPPDTWLWEFGDGTISDTQNPVHTYADSGFYMVCLTITADSSSCTSNYCEEVFTGYTPPPSDCESFIMLNNMDGLTVDFQGYTISQYPTDYMWEFGDGTSGTGEYISHTFSSPGMYNVYLNTVDATGCTYQTLTQVWLDSTFQGCSNYFTYVQNDSNTYTFNGVVYLNNGGTYPDSSATYSWDFGDGTSGTGQTITHYFQENPAGYNVCLTTAVVLSDGSMCTAVYCEYIPTVDPSFTIFGIVYLENNLLADQAVVHLMSMDSLWQGVVEIGSTTIDSGGFYSFPEIPMYNGRLYFTQAELTEGSAYFGEYLPTYHLSAMSWEQASPILPLNNWSAEIFMIPGSPVEGGSGTITGVVTELGSRGFMSDVEVVLMDSESNPLIYLRSDDQGLFSFENVPFGTYIIHAEIMGIHTVQAEINLSEENPVSSVEVLVSSTEANFVFGMREHQINLGKVGDIFPNPVNDNAQVEITIKKAVELQVSIFSQTGQVISVNALKLQEGTHNYQLETESLPIGLYLLRISTDQGEVVSRKFMKIQ